MTLAQDVLKKMLELPNRSAGTVFEQRAADYIKSVYSYLGLQPKEVNSSTIVNSSENHLIISFLLIIATILVNFLNIGLITVPVFIITILVYVRAFNLPFRFFKNRALSKNIYVEIPAKVQEKSTLVITSYYDTSRDLTSIFSVLGPVYSYLNRSGGTLNIPEYLNHALIVPNLALGATFLALFIPDNAAKFFFGFVAGVPLAVGIYLLQKSKSKTTIGAYDNGVANALSIEMASIVSKNPLDSTRVIFAHIAAGTTLTSGSLSFLNSLNIDKLKTFIIDVNCIGEDDLVLIDSEPSYPLGLHVPFDSSFDVLADWAEDYSASTMKIIQSPIQSSNQNLIVAGYRVTGMIASLPKNNYPINFHSSKDTFERIKWDKVEASRDFILGYIQYFDDVTKEVVL